MARLTQHELQGYLSIFAMEILKYRQSYGAPEGVNPFYSYVPTYSHVSDNEIDHLQTFAPIMRAIRANEDEVQNAPVSVFNIVLKLSV